MDTWQWNILAMFMCHFATANRIILVDKAFLNCLQELRSEPNSGVTIKGITLLSKSKQCSNRSKDVEKLINHETKNEITMVFADNKIILETNDEQVELIRNDIKENRNLLNGGQRFFGLPSLSSVFPRIKSLFGITGPYGQQPGDQYGQTLQINVDPYGQPLSRSPINPYGQPFEQLPTMAKISGNILDGVSKFIDHIWYFFVGALNRFVNKYGDSPGCLLFPSINFDNPSISLRFERFQICGLANAFLTPMFKTIGPEQWTATSTIELRDMTMTFGSFYLYSPLLPWPFSNINLEAVQFHFDRIHLKTSIIVPFKLLMIPTNFHVNVEDMDNFKVYFLTPNPSFKQRLMATSMEKSAQFVMNTILEIVSSVLSLPNLLTKITSFLN